MNYKSLEIQNGILKKTNKTLNDKVSKLESYNGSISEDALEVLIPNSEKSSEMVENNGPNKSNFTLTKVTPNLLGHGSKLGGSRKSKRNRKARSRRSKRIA
jgi:hypothetical protein